MIKLTLVLFMTMLSCLGSAFAAQGSSCQFLFATAPVRVLNVFFDPINSEFAVNTVSTVNGSYQTDFMRTRQVTLNTKQILGCKDGCVVNIEAESQTKFSLLLGQHEIASIMTSDPDGLLPSIAFSINSMGLALDLDVLIARSKTTVNSSSMSVVVH